MRIGANPAKTGLPAYQPQPLGVAVIVYIPLLEGYFAHALHIFRLQLASLRRATPEPFDLLVFDNGSCPAVVDELQRLQRDGVITWLVLSRHNLGKAGAWNWIFACMPNELIAYADSDVLFRPGWLEASRRILAAFPAAGMVAAQPGFYDVLDGAGRAHLNLLEEAGAGGRYALETYRPAQAVIDEYCLGIGADAELARRFQAAELPAIRALPAGPGGVSTPAVLSASHMQFVIPRHVARQVTPLPAAHALLRKETMSLDRRIDELGCLHLSTLEAYVFHLGNGDPAQIPDERIAAELRSLDTNLAGSTAASSAAAPAAGRRLWLARLARHPRLNRYFVRLYNLLFRLLYGEGHGGGRR